MARTCRHLAVALAFALAFVTSSVRAEGPPGSAAATDPDFWEEIAATAEWVARDRGVAAPPLPRLVFLERERLVAAYDAARSAPPRGRSASSNVLAFYDGRRGTIYLASGWTGRDPIELSILVHEMVHHFQEAEGERFACGAERERDAYAAQERWLAEHGLSLQETLGIDPLFVLLVTNCMF